MKNITTLGELKASGYQSKSIKDELRDNLIEKIKNKEAKVLLFAVPSVSEENNFVLNCSISCSRFSLSLGVFCNKNELIFAFSLYS